MREPMSRLPRIVWLGLCLVFVSVGLIAVSAWQKSSLVPEVGSKAADAIARLGPPAVRKTITDKEELLIWYVTAFTIVGPQPAVVHVVSIDGTVARSGISTK